VDAGTIDHKPLVLDVTEAMTVQQRFDARLDQGERFIDDGYGEWLNRLTLALRWTQWTAGVRLDSSVYWLRPEDRPSAVPSDEANILELDKLSRYRNAIYPAKMRVTYAAPGVEATVGDAYVQFGRGIILSMRKLDDLGIDTTLRGGKIEVQEDPFAATVVAGFANPARVDDATGRALFLPTQSPTLAFGSQPLFGSDRIIGAEIQAGRGLPVVLATHAVRLTRCAPLSYGPQGQLEDTGTFDAPFGSCNPTDTAAWLATLTGSTNPLLNASEVEMAGQSLEIPKILGHAKIYVEAAVQREYHDTNPDDRLANGNALYGSATVDVGPTTHTLEVKSYRNFYALPAAIDVNRAVEFNNVVYSTVPTAELVSQDTFGAGFFNACVDGGRLRSDVRTSDQLLIYGAGIYAFSKSEVPGGRCDSRGNTVSGSLSPDAVQTTTYDGLGGFEFEFDTHRSHVFVSGGARVNDTVSGDLYYHEQHLEYSIAKYVDGPYSVEVTGRYRSRKLVDENLRGPQNTEAYWHEGDNYVALKIAPRWVFSQGFEYTTQLGFPTYYFNGSVLFKPRSDWAIRAFAGQQRGQFLCLSGVCKFFPPYEGGRVDVTLRF
jgi:hypothetical protein